MFSAYLSMRFIKAAIQHDFEKSFWPSAGEGGLFKGVAQGVKQQLETVCSEVEHRSQLLFFLLAEELLSLQ